MSDWINDRTARPASLAGERARPAWRVVVPVKGGPGAKSRLRPPDGVDRPALARALALDTVAAAYEAVGAVLVVTSDAETAHAARALGARLVTDPGGGLNQAVRAGLDAAGDDRHSTPLAALLGDLPALRPAELLAALAAVPAGGSAFVPDAEGTGTVLLASRVPAGLTPRFGAGSAAAHEDDGHVRLELDAAGLRRDVDDEQSLRRALELGVGAHTAGLLAHLIGFS